MNRRKNCATTIRDKTNLWIICLAKQQQQQQQQNRNKNKNKNKTKQNKTKHNKAKQNKTKQNKNKNKNTNKQRTSSHKLSVSYEKDTTKDLRPIIKPWLNLPVWSKTTEKP